MSICYKFIEHGFFKNEAFCKVEQLFWICLLFENFLNLSAEAQLSIFCDRTASQQLLFFAKLSTSTTTTTTTSRCDLVLPMTSRKRVFPNRRESTMTCIRSRRRCRSRCGPLALPPALSNSLAAHTRALFRWASPTAWLFSSPSFVARKPLRSLPPRKASSRSNVKNWWWRFSLSRPFCHFPQLFLLFPPFRERGEG